MAKDDKRIIDMTLEGDFIAPPPSSKPPLGTRIMLWAAVAIVLSVAVLTVALTFWFLLMLLPLVLLAALVGYVVFRYQFWRHKRSFMVRRGPGRW